MVGDSGYPNAASSLTGSNCSNIVYGNEAYNFSNWDNSSELNHHDGIHTWANQNGSKYYVCVISNYIHGSLSSSGAYFGGGYYIESTTAGGVAANNIVDSSSLPRTHVTRERSAQLTEQAQPTAVERLLSTTR